MYHGSTVPGFPSHPHRGFETVTFVRRGLVDHADSMGASARYGRGDVQWLTAGGGIQHAEMFPLLDTTGSNPLELFQIWLNLPAADKMVPPYFTMFWHEQIPHRRYTDANGRHTDVTVIAGALEDIAPLAPPPNSWGANPDSDLAIWAITMEEGATWTVPPARHETTNRALHFFNGTRLRIGRNPEVPAGDHQVKSDVPATIEAVGGPAEILLLQGRPIGEPVAQYGPFVMNTQAELQQAFADFRRTQFGGWPWPDNAPVHGGSDAGRFAKHADGKIEKAG
jgi:redox-sensitive bicupin YhaK (pirin superfamily)